jgi:hypothetical protein
MPMGLSAAIGRDAVRALAIVVLRRITLLLRRCSLRNAGVPRRQIKRVGHGLSVAPDYLHG